MHLGLARSWRVDWGPYVIARGTRDRQLSLAADAGAATASAGWSTVQTLWCWRPPRAEGVLAPPEPHQSLPVAHRVAGGYFPRLDASRAPEAVAGAHQVQAFAYRQAGQRRGAHAPCAGSVLKDGPRPDHHRAMRLPIDS